MQRTKRQRKEITNRTSNRGRQIRNTEAYKNPHLNTIEDLSVQIGEVNAEIRTVLKPKYEELMAKAKHARDSYDDYVKKFPYNTIGSLLDHANNIS